MNIYKVVLHEAFIRLTPQIKGRTLRVDHVSNYRPPKDSEDIDDVTRHLREEGCAPKAPSLSESESGDESLLPLKKPKKGKWVLKIPEQYFQEDLERSGGFIRVV